MTERKMTPSNGAANVVLGECGACGGVVVVPIAWPILYDAKPVDRPFCRDCKRKTKPQLSKMEMEDSK